MQWTDINSNIRTTLFRYMRILKVIRPSLSTQLTKTELDVLLTTAPLSYLHIRTICYKCKLHFDRMIKGTWKGFFLNNIFDNVVRFEHAVCQDSQFIGNIFITRTKDGNMGSSKYYDIPINPSTCTFDLDEGSCKDNSVIEGELWWDEL